MDSDEAHQHLALAHAESTAKLAARFSMRAKAAEVDWIVEQLNPLPRDARSQKRASLKLGDGDEAVRESGKDGPAQGPERRGQVTKETYPAPQQVANQGDRPILVPERSDDPIRSPDLRRAQQPRDPSRVQSVAEDARGEWQIRQPGLRARGRNQDGTYWQPGVPRLGRREPM